MTYMHVPPEDPGTYCRFCDSDPCKTAGELDPCKERWFYCSECGRHIDRKLEETKRGTKCGSCDPVEDMTGVPQIVRDLVQNMSDDDREYFLSVFRRQP